MQEIIGDLWSEIGKADLLLVTTNSFVRKNGALVMGRGAAKEAVTRYPSLPFDFGKQIVHKRPRDYWIVLSPVIDQGTQIGAFQVKRFWGEPANLTLISLAVGTLRLHASLYTRIAMNFPGIGNGRLTREQVLPIVERLPDNVFLYRRVSE